jgi:hypothetical protein
VGALHPVAAVAHRPSRSRPVLLGRPALVLDKLEWVIWALAISQGLQVMITTFWRAGRNLVRPRALR